MKIVNKKTSNLTIIYGITFVVAFCSIAYELLLAHTISIVAASTVVWYGIVVGMFLGSLGVGSFYSGKLLKKIDAYSLLLKIELMLTFFGSCVAIVVFFARNINFYMLALNLPRLGTVSFVGLCLLAVIIVGLLSGVELPLLMRIGSKEKGRDISNRILAVDYFGSLLGSIVFPLVLIPNMNVILIGFFLASINLAAALLLASYFHSKFIIRTAFLAPFVLLAAFMAAGFIFGSVIDMFFAKKYYYYPDTQSFRSLFMPLAYEPDIKRTQSPYQIIDLVEIKEALFYEDFIDLYIDQNCNSDTPNGNVELYLNGDWQLDIRTEKVYHEYFAHVPIILSGQVPKKVLVLGGGDGMLDRELLKYKQIEKIVHVDLDQKVIDIASNNGVLNEVNNNSLQDERVEIIIDDGYSFVKNADMLFDAVYIDFPTPNNYNIARLYSTEFYSFVRKIIKDNGFVAYDAPGMNSIVKYDQGNNLVIDEKSKIFASYYDTIRNAGYKTVIPFFSALETNNEKALIVARDRALGEQIEEKYQRNKRTKNAYLLEKKANLEGEERVKEFARNIMEGFIYASINENEINKSYQDNKIPTCFLNEQRFNLSQRVKYNVPPTFNRKNVNSIMKPLLPLSNFSRVRMPYTLE